MRFSSRSLAAAVFGTQAVIGSSDIRVPSLNVPACPSKSTLQYSRSVPDNKPFPLTQASLCYTNTSISIDFIAYNETNFYFNPNYTTNSPIYQYEVMEVFIYQGTKDPQTYLEFEIAPNNVTFQAFIYNPSKVRAAGAPFDTFYVQTPQKDGLTATTKLNKPRQMWTSSVLIPLGFFNVDNGTARGTKWRMNFFRTVVSPKTFPAQLLGSWSPVPEPNFHETPYFGDITFV